MPLSHDRNWDGETDLLIVGAESRHGTDRISHPAVAERMFPGRIP